MIVIGSTALPYHIGGIEPKDLDLVCSYDEAVAYGKKHKVRSFYPINDGKTIAMKAQDGSMIEAEITWPGSRAEKLHAFVMEVDRPIWYDMAEDWHVPSLDALYMLKMSHRYLKNSPHFLKTMEDIHMLRRHGCKIPDWMQEFYEERMKATYTYGLPKLNVSKNAFFDSEMTGVFQKYEHDDIHLAVAHMDKPAYTYFKADEAEVMCSKALFYNQPREVQLYSFVEEAMVLALERSLVPFPGAKTPRQAFDIGMMKICTSIASGWWREAAWEGYYEAVALYDDSYVDKFNKAVDNGQIKLKENASV